MKYITQLEQFKPNDLEDVGSWSPWDYLCQITRDYTEQFCFCGHEKIEIFLIHYYGVIFVSQNGWFTGFKMKLVLYWSIGIWIDKLLVD